MPPHGKVSKIKCVAKVIHVNKDSLGNVPPCIAPMQAFHILVGLDKPH